LSLKQTELTPNIGYLVLSIGRYLDDKVADASPEVLDLG